MREEVGKKSVFWFQEVENGPPSHAPDPLKLVFHTLHGVSAWAKETLSRLDPGSSEVLRPRLNEVSGGFGTDARFPSSDRGVERPWFSHGGSRWFEAGAPRRDNWKVADSMRRSEDQKKTQ